MRPQVDAARRTGAYMSEAVSEPFLAGARCKLSSMRPGEETLVNTDGGVLSRGPQSRPARQADAGRSTTWLSLFAKARSLVDMISTLPIGSGGQDLWTAVLSRLFDLLSPVDAAAIAIKEVGQPYLQVVACLPLGSSTHASHRCSLPSAEALSLVYITQKPLYLAGGVGREEASLSVNSEDRSTAGTPIDGSSVICAPLVVSGQVVGAVRLDREASKPAFSERDLDALNAIVAHPLVATDNNATLFAELQNRRVRTNEALRRIILAAEEEQARAVDALQGGVARVQAALLTARAELSSASDSVPEARHLNDAVAQIDQEVQEAMQFTLDMTSTIHHPVLDDLGLASTIEWLVQTLLPDPSIETRVQLDRSALHRLPKAIAVTVLRILHELLSNVARHSGAGCVELIVQQEGDWLRLEVADDGSGFTADDLTLARSPGWRRARDRAQLIGARLMVSSALGRGTRALLSIPGSSEP